MTCRRGRLGGALGSASRPDLPRAAAAAVWALPWGPAAVRVQSATQLYFPRCIAGWRYGQVARLLAEAF